MSDGKAEDSGGSVSYYVIEVTSTWQEGKAPYTAECGELIEALAMTPVEANIFKELWRRAAARQGKKKRGNTSLRGAQKIKYFGDRLLIIEERKK